MLHLGESSMTLICPLAAQGHRSATNALGYNALGLAAMQYGMSVFEQLVKEAADAGFRCLMLRSPCGVTAYDGRRPKRHLLDMAGEIVDPMGYPVFARWSPVAMETFPILREMVHGAGLVLGLWVGLATARDDGKDRSWISKRSIDAHVADVHGYAWMGYDVIGGDAINWAVGKGGKPRYLVEEYRDRCRRSTALFLGEGHDVFVAGLGNSDKPTLEERMLEADDPDQSMFILHGNYRELVRADLPKHWALTINHAERVGLLRGGVVQRTVPRV